MKPSLEHESGKLLRSWTRHDAAMLRDYLVAGVEDPRLNLQSILSRHFLARALTGERLGPLMEAEYRFGAAMTWLTRLARRFGDPEEPAVLLYTLRRGADNAEGIEIPQFVVETFAALPAQAGELTVPNYLESFLTGAQFVGGRLKPHEPSLDTFCCLWSRALVAEAPTGRACCPQRAAANPEHPQLSEPLVPSRRAEDSAPYLQPVGAAQAPALSVLEPACGSANDYRCLHATGLARLLDYTGFDLCTTNVENACALFPGVRFKQGNVFAIAEPDKSFDLCFVHDLFEHLSLEGVETAVAEICRVTRRGLCVGFFNMDETREHVLEPVEDYHWNTLSMGRMRELFARHGFTGQVLHIGTFLRRQVGCEETHNPNAYTFLLQAAGSA